MTRARGRPVGGALAVLGAAACGGGFPFGSVAVIAGDVRVTVDSVGPSSLADRRWVHFSVRNDGARGILLLGCGIPWRLDYRSGGEWKYSTENTAACLANVRMAPTTVPPGGAARDSLIAARGSHRYLLRVPYHLAEDAHSGRREAASLPFDVP